MVIMNPQNVILIDRFQQRFAEDFVDFLILNQVSLVVAGIGGKIMKKRPDRLIAKALIKILKIFFGEKNGLRTILGSGSRANLVFLSLVDRAARPTYPEILRPGG